MGFECNGNYKGKHGASWDGSHDNEKIRLAQILGYRIMPFSNKEILTGEAKAWLSRFL